MIKLKLFYFVFLFISIPSVSYAMNCKETLNDVEEIICKEKELFDMDLKFNQQFNLLKKEVSAQDFLLMKESIKNLLDARNKCVDVYGIITKDFLAEKNIDKLSYQKGCIETFYSNITSVISNPKIFEFPSKTNYIEFFLKLAKEDLPVSFKEKEVQGSEENTKFQFLFNKNDNWYAQENSTKSWYGAAHPYYYESKKFFIWNKKKGKISELSAIVNGTNACSVPIQNPMSINNKTYIPESISFTEVFSQFFGVYYEDSQTLATAFVYEPDCLLRLQDLNQEAQNFYVFSKNYLDGKNYLGTQYTDDSANQKLKCLYDLVLKNSYSIEGFNGLCNGGKLADEGDKCIFVEEEKMNLIKSKLPSSCK